MAARRAVGGVGAVGLAVAALVALPAPASAAGRVELSVATADPEYATAVDLRGTGFQSVPNAHGGIYVLFGWVGGTWQPSRGGQVGADYRYVQDSEAKDNNGFQRFVAFPGSDTASSANGGTIAPDGSWSARLVIPGARFAAVDRSGNTTQVDCTTAQCGVITIGAHGVVNPNNETFTPVRFAVPQGQQQGQPQQPTQAPPTAGTTVDAPVRPAAAPAVVNAARTALPAGESTAVTGSGFAAGEQVQVALGSVFLPPVTADQAGAVAYTASIPSSVLAGVHRLAFTGTTSGAGGGVDLTVDPPVVATTAVAAGAQPEPGGPDWTLVGGIAAGLVVVGAVVVLLKRRRTA
ncbi:hypothetical protein AB0I60_30235 [Actinosynnema sp. NPDC050436]|uniref:hypothetical protein n=1 Tax=Actinosynnema sp. NPDC050436 TaxID=3155659 RepID=UPI0033C11C92